MSQARPAWLVQPRSQAAANAPSRTAASPCPRTLSPAWQRARTPQHRNSKPAHGPRHELQRCCSSCWRQFAGYRARPQNPCNLVRCSLASKKPAPPRRSGPPRCRAVAVRLSADSSGRARLMPRSPRAINTGPRHRPLRPRRLRVLRTRPSRRRLRPECSPPVKAGERRPRRYGMGGQLGSARLDRAALGARVAGWHTFKQQRDEQNAPQHDPAAPQSALQSAFAGTTKDRDGQ